VYTDSAKFAGKRERRRKRVYKKSRRGKEAGRNSPLKWDSQLFLASVGKEESTPLMGKTNIGNSRKKERIKINNLSELLETAKSIRGGGKFCPVHIF